MPSLLLWCHLRSRPKSPFRPLPSPPLFLPHHGTGHTRPAGRNRSVDLPHRGRLRPEGHWLTCSGMIEAPSTLPAMPSLAAAAAAAAEEGMQQQEREQEEEHDDSADGEWHEVVLLPREILRESPSQRLGVPEAVERRHRIFGCELIQEAGILLRQPQVVMATAQTLFHRFFYRRAFTSETAQTPPVLTPGKAPRAFLFDAFTAAMGCVFLASKLEEKPRAPRDVIFVFHHMCRRRRSLPPSLLEVTSSRYHDLREALLTIEKYVLKELGFGFYNVMDHPHKFILYYIKTLGGSPELAQRAWNYLNDSLRLDCCVRYRAELIACAALFMAARDLRIKLPDSPPWYGLFGASLTEIREVGNAILSLYHQQDEEGEEGPLRWLEPLHPFSLVGMEALGRVEGGGGDGGRGTAGENAKMLVTTTSGAPGKKRSGREGGGEEGGEEEEDAAVTEEVEPTRGKKEKREMENGHDANEDKGDEDGEESDTEKKRLRKKRKKRQSRSRSSRSSSSSSSPHFPSTTATAGVAASDAAADGEKKASKPSSFSRSFRRQSRSSSPPPAVKARSRSRGRERGREERRKHRGRSRTRSRSKSRERGGGGRERGRERERERERVRGREGGRKSGGGGGGRDYDDRREGASHHRGGAREGGNSGGSRSRYDVERKESGSGSGALGGGYREKESDRFRRDRSRER